MRARGVDDGHIINICSITGHLSPFWTQVSVYSASKHAVRVLTEGLRKELVAAKSRVRVTEVSPGFVKTDIFETSGTDMKLLENVSFLEPEDIADIVLYTLGVPPHVQVSVLHDCLGKK
ncbi:Dehydrogenase/reductase SDR family protein 7-like [Gryllus bimaculatus]|nr:Dehydrogenase/reductase SDR family protein 7-like [Gryllus bimaculatus]